ncbi:hypothetical protein U1Q18_004475 [Sarracenia purpurea var. burkii]
MHAESAWKQGLMCLEPVVWRFRLAGAPRFFNVEAHKKQGRFFFFGPWKNAIFRGGTKKGSSEIATFATTYISEYQQGVARMIGPTMNKPICSNWEPPKSGWIKANFDRARNKDGKAGMRVILKDDKGKI